MGEWFALPFTLIGVVVVGLVLWAASSHTLRAIRQGHRVATVCARLGGKRKVTWLGWWKGFRYEWSSVYDSLQIGPYQIDRDPNVPIRRAYRYLD